MHTHPTRRTFITHLGVATAAAAGTGLLPPDLHASLPPAETGPWDMSWIEAVERASYRAVVDVSTLEDGYALHLAGMLIDQVREVHGVPDEQVRIVLVHRRGGTPIVFNDALWARFPRTTGLPRSPTPPNGMSPR